jgi:isocitrate dehydrogenase
MFEAIHGTAPDIAGKNIANPSGLLLAGVMMLVHLGQPEAATKVHNAWLATLEQGIHTADIYKEGVSKEKVGTCEFADAVIERLGQKPELLQPVHYVASDAEYTLPTITPRPPAKRELVGIDVFLDYEIRDPNQLGNSLKAACDGDGMELLMITNRGVKVFPNGLPETFCTDHWRCRFMSTNGTLNHANLLSLLDRVSKGGFEFIKTELLFNFDGVPGYSLGQGQ